MSNDLTTSTAATEQITSSTTTAAAAEMSTPETATTPPAIPAENENGSAATAAEQATNAVTLPADYLAGGYFKGEGKDRYPDPALVDYAESIAQVLTESKTPPSAINKMVRTLKSAARLPYEAQQGALKKLTPQVLDLERKKKAPALLRFVVERNTAAVRNAADFAACLDHFKDIAIYLAAAQS